MNSDEQLIERIRTALREEADEMLPALDLLDRVCAQPAAGAARRSRVPGRVGGFTAVLAGVAVVAVVVFVIGAVGHGRPNSAAGARPRAVNPAIARALVARLAVFRRSQTPADRLPAAVMRMVRDLDHGLVPGLTRLATTIDVGPGRLAAVRVYMIVVAGTGRTGGYAAVRIALVSASPNPSLLELSGAMTANATATFAYPFNVPAVVVGHKSVRINLWLGVVLDGVTRAKWVLSTFPRNTGPDQTLFASVANNVAFAIGASNATNVLSATAYASSGRVVSSVSGESRVRALNAQMRQLSRSAHEPTPPALKQHFAIFSSPPLRAAPIKPLPVYARTSVATNPQAPNIDQARFVRYPGTPGFWVIPGRNGVVIATLLGKPGLSLNGQPLRGSASVLDDHMITTIGSAPPHETVFGLVPDGNPTVTITLSNGTRKTVRVIDNIYAVTLTTQPTTMSAKNASGRQVTVRVPG